MLIRRKVAADVAAIDRVHAAAFAATAEGAEPVEVGLVHALRAGPSWIPALSLVAEDPEDGRVIGHVVCTRGYVGATPGLGLGPIGVSPDRQRATGPGMGRLLQARTLSAYRPDMTGPFTYADPFNDL